MGFFQMLAVNRELNQAVSEIQNKFHRLEDLINGHRGVDSQNFAEVNTLISSISRDVLEMSRRVERLGYAEQVSLLLAWSDGRKYPWSLWNSFAMLQIGEAKLYVNRYHPGYYKQ